MSPLSAGRLAPNRSDATPLYVQLANNLRSAIAQGGVDAGGALPSERVLSELTGASRVTIRKAIEQLVEEGLILRRHGSGTFLADRIEQRTSHLTGFSADARDRGEAPGSIWLVRALSLPTNEEAAVLRLAGGEQVARFGRVRLADGEPLAIEHAVVPASCLDDVHAVGDSLYSALERAGKRPASGEQRLRASLATPVEAGLLSVDEGSELLRIERRTFLEDGTPVEFTRSAYRGDRYEYVAELGQLRDQ